MKIGIIGSSGSMGRRYNAICEYLGYKTIKMDINDPINLNVDRMIIATPTQTHYEVWKSIKKYIPILVEKPMSKDIKECIDMSIDERVSVVCNWSLVLPFILKPNSHQIIYNFYNTGKDGVYWDTCQLIYLAKSLPLLATDSPMFMASVDFLPITLTDIERSYIKMIELWVINPSLLWNGMDGLSMTQRVLEYAKK